MTLVTNVTKLSTLLKNITSFIIVPVFLESVLIIVEYNVKSVNRQLRMFNFSKTNNMKIMVTNVTKKRLSW